MSIGERIRSLREAQGLTQQQLGEIAGVSDKAVSTWENNANIPRMGAIQRIADHFGIKKSDIIEEDSVLTHPDFLTIARRRIPLLGNIQCGEPTYAAAEFESYVEVGAAVQCDFALRAKGDSMTGARIHNGDIVFIRRQDTVLNGEIAAVLLDDDATLKRVRFIPGGITMLLAENPKYEPIIGDSETRSVRILGKAVAFQANVY